MGEEICKFISGSPSKLSSRWFSFSWLTGANIGCSWIWSRLFINGHRIDSPSLFFSSWFFIYLVSYKHKSLFSWPVAPFVVSFFSCFLSRQYATVKPWPFLFLFSLAMANNG